MLSNRVASEFHWNSAVGEKLCSDRVIFGHRGDQPGRKAVNDRARRLIPREISIEYSASESGLERWVRLDK